MQRDFHKMHGAGNDFVVLDGREDGYSPDRATIVRLADRRTGIGCDQLVLLEAVRSGRGDVRARFFNPDGAEAGACGNATRCVAWLMTGGVSGTVQVRTSAGLLPARVLADGQVEVDMGPPGLGWRDLPLSRAADTLHLPLPHDPAGCSMGNPHATFFDHPKAAEIAGPVLETDPLFPERANIGFASVASVDRIRLRVWERGAGLTLACGSGACAALVNASRRGLTGRRAMVEMQGGVLTIDWGVDDHVRMTGPAVLAFTGTVSL